MSEMTTAAGAPSTARASAGRAQPARWRGGTAVAALVAGFVLGQLAALGIVAAAGGDDAPLTASAAAFALGDLVVLAVVIFAARRGAERLGPATLGLRRTRFWPAAGWMLAIYFGVISAEGAWSLIVGGAPSTRGHDVAHPATATALLGLFAIAVVAPIVEEVAFRGYLFPALTRWRGPWIGAALTAVLFGVAHAGVYPLRFLPALAAFGFGACLLYWFTGSLLPSIALHALNNALVLSVAFHWSWQVPLAVVGAVAVAQLIVAPFARERAPLTA
jgi:hypothetical protein